MSTKLNERQLHDLFDDALNESMPLVAIGSLNYLPADVLKAVDPVAYNEEYKNWLDANNYEEI